jgi:antitoxin component YwqK of YwqJK toxin-antitoxin module
MGSTTFFRTTYLNGTEIGPSICTEKGRVTYLTALSNGKIHGAQYELYKDGTLAWYLVYENGEVKDGTYYHFDSNGKIIQSDTYKKGKLRKSIKYYVDEPPRIRRYK